MKNSSRHNLAVVCLLAVSPIILAQERSKINVGAEVGAYFPLDSVIKDRFGSPLPRIGLSPLDFKRTKMGRLFTDISFISSRDGDFDSKFAMVPLVVGYEFDLGKTQGFNKFARVATGVAYLDYSIQKSSTDRVSTKRFVPITSLEIGAMFRQNLKLSGRVYITPSTDGISFTGIELTAAVTLFKF